MTIHDDAWEGSLDTIKLKGYLEADKELINELHDGKGITPLAGATIKGHVTVVENLLQSKADPNKPSRTGETALVFAATRTTKNRAQIIRLLLGYGADPNITCAHRDGNTPLMLVILYRKDIEAITQLVDAKASLTVTNRDGKTATDLADKTNDPRVIEALLPKEQRAWRLAVVVDLITSLIKFILAWVNNPTISGAVKGTVKRLYNMDVPVDREIEQVRTHSLENSHSYSTYSLLTASERYRAANNGRFQEQRVEVR